MSSKKFQGWLLGIFLLVFIQDGCREVCFNMAMTILPEWVDNQKRLDLVTMLRDGRFIEEILELERRTKLPPPHCVLPYAIYIGSLYEYTELKIVERRKWLAENCREPWTEWIDRFDDFYYLFMEQTDAMLFKLFLS